MIEIYFLCIYCCLHTEKSIKQLNSLIAHSLTFSIHFSQNWHIAVVATSVVDREKIVYHISVTRNEHRQLYLQLIIVDRYEYDEQSTRLMKHLKSSVLNELYEGE